MCVFFYFHVAVLGLNHHDMTLKDPTFYLPKVYVLVGCGVRHWHCIYLLIVCGRSSKNHLYGLNNTNTCARVSIDGNLFFLGVLFDDAVKC
jgi:hypothetical protein